MAGRDEFFCRYCLEVTEADDYPDECPHCRVGFSVCCGTRLKTMGKPQWCPGCGTIGPTVKAAMYRTSSTSGAYGEDAWVWEGIHGHGIAFSEFLRDRKATRFGISSGWETPEAHATKQPTNVWLRRETYGGSPRGEKVRDLTDDECRLLGYRTKAEREAAAHGDAS